MPEKGIPLARLGWNLCFQRQLSPEEWESHTPVRVFAFNRHLLDVVGEAGRHQLALPPAWLKSCLEDRPTVGDWVLLDDNGQAVRLLQRTSLFKRMAAGRDARVQLMAANVDILFVVSSCNREFNLSRMERYLAMALDAGVEPVVVLTKVDLIEDVEVFRQQVEPLRPGLAVVAVNCKEERALEILEPWCRFGKTVALVGSSGVGKSTLVNTLSTSTVQETGTVRHVGAKGRHTTTGRSLHLLPGGSLLLDSPGLRELQLSGCDEGVAVLFEEIEKVASCCRFNDCRHEGEMGCAVAIALENGEIEERRLENYLKLRAEQERTEEALVEKRRKGKSFGKMVKQAKAFKRKGKGWNQHE